MRGGSSWQRGGGGEAVAYRCKFLSFQNRLSFHFGNIKTSDKITRVQTRLHVLYIRIQNVNENLDYCTILLVNANETVENSCK